MVLISSRKAWYPAFWLGAEPKSIECDLSIVEANGKRYLKTPFAMLDAHADDDHERAIDGRGYYATQAECDAYLAYEYPWWQHAAPIADALCEASRLQGKTVGEGRIADKVGACVFNGEVFRLARGHKSFTLKAIRAAVRALAAKACIA